MKAEVLGSLTVGVADVTDERGPFWLALTRFSLTMPSLAAKKAKTCEMKCISSGFNLSQCSKSLDKSTWGMKHTWAGDAGLKIFNTFSTQPNLFNCPEGGLGLFVHLPNVGVLDGEDDKASGILLQQRFLLSTWTFFPDWGLVFQAILQRNRAQCSIEVKREWWQLYGRRKFLKKLNVLFSLQFRRNVITVKCHLRCHVQNLLLRQIFGC